MEGRLRNSVKKTCVRQQNMKAGVVEAVGTGKGEAMLHTVSGAGGGLRGQAQQEQGLWGLCL